MSNEKIIDPVCEMIVDIAEARDLGLTLEYPDREYAFCAAGCQAKFAAEPEGVLPFFRLHQHRQPGLDPHGTLLDFRREEVEFCERKLWKSQLTVALGRYEEPLMSDIHLLMNGGDAVNKQSNIGSCKSSFRRDS